MFKGGQSIGQYPLRLVWTWIEERRSPFPVQMSVSVPKKRFKRAVDRNRIKRLIREAYRLNKHRLYQGLQGEERQIAWMILFTGREEPTYREVEQAVQLMIKRFLKKQKNAKNT